MAKLTLIRGIGELLTLEEAWRKSGRHIQENDLGVIRKAAVVMDGKQILWVGPETKLKSNLTHLISTRTSSARSISLTKSMSKQKLSSRAKKGVGSSKQKLFIKEYDVKGQTVLPGWVDCHTHTVFAGSRSEEFEWRCQGISYQEIAQKGGGILSTMKATRQVSKNDLLTISQARVNEFLRQGVTTLEIKSGYGLELNAEIKQLEVARSLVGPRVLTTFLGAHAIPPEFSSAPAYLIYLVDKVLPKLVQKRLADRVDIFIEKNFFEVHAARTYLQKAKELGFPIVIHADQLSLSGGTALAVELGASSADHVIQLSDKEMDLLASSSTTTAVLLPLADLYMKCAYPPARSLIDRGACVALATDFNPGSCPSQDVQLVGLLARLEMKMTLPEIISAWTIGGARALGLFNVGSLQKGFSADLQVIDQDWRSLFYQAGRSPVTQLWAKGKKQFAI